MVIGELRESLDRAGFLWHPVKLHWTLIERVTWLGFVIGGGTAASGGVPIDYTEGGNQRTPRMDMLKTAPEHLKKRVLEEVKTETYGGYQWVHLSKTYQKICSEKQ